MSNWRKFNMSNSDTYPPIPTINANIYYVLYKNETGKLKVSLAFHYVKNLAFPVPNFQQINTTKNNISTRNLDLKDVIAYCPIDYPTIPSEEELADIFEDGLSKILVNLKTNGFEITTHYYNAYGGIINMGRIEYIATDGNVFLYIQPVHDRFLAVATDEEMDVDLFENKGIAEYLFYRKRDLRSNNLYICNHDHSKGEILGALNDYYKRKDKNE